MSHYPSAKFADRTLGLVLIHDPKTATFSIGRFRRQKPFATANPFPPQDAYEKLVPLNGPLECDLSVDAKGVGIFSVENLGWAELWMADTAVFLGGSGSFTGNGTELPSPPNWPNTSDGSLRTLNLKYAAPTANAPATVTWRSSEGASGTMPFRRLMHVKEMYGLAVVLRLCNPHRGRLTWKSGNPWPQNPEIVFP